MESKLLKRISLFILIACVAITGCSFSRSYVYKPMNTTSLGKIALLPFENVTDYPNAGTIITRLMTTELYAKKKFDLMKENDVMEKLLIVSEGEYAKKIRKLSFAQTDELMKIGQALEVDTLMVGTVTEYRYKRGLGENPVVGVSARMIEVKTGELLWASSYSREGVHVFTKSGNLNALAQKVCYLMVRNLLWKMNQFSFNNDKRYRGFAKDVGSDGASVCTGDTVYVTAGSSNGNNGTIGNKLNS